MTERKRAQVKVDVANERIDSLICELAAVARELDLARGALAADSNNQRAQLAEHDLEDEFVAHIGCDLASGLGEALVVARQERNEARSEVKIGAAMLARQCDLARVAETERDEARDVELEHRRRAHALLDRKPCGHLVADSVESERRPLVEAIDAAIYDCPGPPCRGCQRAAHESNEAERQLDSARAEAAAAEARAETLREVLVLVDRWLDSPPLRRIATSADLHGAGITDAEFAQYGKPALDALAAALALPADRTALDAMLAEARREGARACVEAAGAATDEMHAEEGFHWTGAIHVHAAVVRAAAEIGQAPKELTP